MTEDIKQLKTTIVRERALRLKEYDDAYPDVGMGGFWFTYVNQALRATGYSEDDVYMDQLI